MNPRSWMTVAAVAAAVTILAFALIAFPDAQWGAPAIVALLLFAASVAGVLAFPASIRSTTTDAVAIASIGPLGVLALGLLFWTGLVLLLALNGSASGLLWGMNALTLGGFVIAYALFRAAM